MQTLWLVLIALAVAVNLRLIAGAVLAYRGISAHPADEGRSAGTSSTLSHV